MDLADAVRQLKPDVAWKGVRLEGGRMNVEDGGPLAWDPGVLPSAARFPNNSGNTRSQLGRKLGGALPEDIPKLASHQET
jgi:hypothetical protein